MLSGLIKSIIKFKLIIFGILLFLLYGSKIVFADSTWDGRYNATFDFKMSAGVCPRILPIEIEIIITNGKAEGFIFNNGGGNYHEFCKLYHNGTITGNINKKGDVDFKIKQESNHSRTYSSYKIEGNIQDKLKLISRDWKFHYPKKFTMNRVAN